MSNTNQLVLNKQAHINLAIDTSVIIALPNGDRVRLYSNHSGEYCAVEVTSHNDSRLELVSLQKRKIVGSSVGESSIIFDNANLRMTRGGKMTTTIEATCHHDF